MKGRETTPRGEGQKKPQGASATPAAHQAAANGVRNVGGRLAPDPRRVAENLKTFFPLEESYPRDLLGDPVPPGRGRSGRPRHVPTPANRARVADLRAEGLSLAAIARDLGVSHPTLQRNYPVELRSGSRTWRRRALTKQED